MDLLTIKDVEIYLSNRQVYFKKEIVDCDFKTIAKSGVVYNVGDVKINETTNKYHNCMCLNINIDNIEVNLYEYKKEHEFIEWIKTNFIPVNELIENFLKDLKPLK